MTKKPLKHKVLVKPKTKPIPVAVVLHPDIAHPIVVVAESPIDPPTLTERIAAFWRGL